MADGTKIGTGYIQVMPEMKDFTKEVKNQVSDSLAEAGESGGNSLGTGIKTGLKAVGTAAVAAAAAVGAIGGASVKAGMDFDAAMSQVAATMGTTTGEIGELRDFAQEMGSTTAFSATEAAQALNYMALAGYDADTSMAMLPTVLDLAAAGGIDLARASDMVTDAQSALGLTTSETTELVDKMAMASSKSNTSVEQLGDAILKIGGTANIMSGGTTELATSLGILADNGIKGAEGGTHLRNILLSLAAPTDTAAAFLEDLGVTAVDSSGNMRPLEDVMLDLNESLEGLGEAEKAAIISQIFNKTDIAAVNALLGTSKDRWNELSGAIDDASGAAQAMAETQLDNLAGDITLFESALEGAKIAISDQLTPTLRDFVQLGTDGLSDVTAAFKEEGLTGAMEALGQFISNALLKINDVLPDLVEAGMNLLTSLVDGIVQNLPSIVSTGAEIATNLISGLAEALPSMLGDLVRSIPDLINTLSTELLPGLISGAIELVGGLIAELPSILLTLVESIPDIFLNLLSGVAQGILEGIANLFDITSLKEQFEMDDFIKDMQSEIDALTDSLDKMEKKRQDSFNAIEAQVGLYQSIKDELLQYVDAEGKIKEGYENEVAGLVALAEQYGIHIDIRDGQIANIQEVCDKIDELIEKYEKEAYTAAETSAIEQAYKDRRQFISEYSEAVRNYYSEMESAQESFQEGDTTAAYMHQQNAKDFVQAAMDAAAGVVREDENIALSKQNLAAIEKGAYDEICYTTEQAGIEISANNTEIGGSLAQLKTDFENNSTNIAGTWEAFMSKVKAYATKQDLAEITDAFNEVFPGLGDIVAEAATAVETSSSQITTSASNMATEVAGSIDIVEADWSDIFTVQIPEDAQTAAEAIGEFPAIGASIVQDNRPQMEAACKGVADAMVEEMSPVPDEMAEIADSAGSSINEGLGSHEGNIQGTAESIANTIENAMAPLPGDMNTAGDSSGSNLDSGFGSWESTISGTV